MTDPTMENKTPLTDEQMREVSALFANTDWDDEQAANNAQHKAICWLESHARDLETKLRAAEQAQKEAEERRDEAYSQRNRARYLQEITENNLYDALKRADQATSEVRDTVEALRHYRACVMSDPQMKFYHGDQLDEKFASVIRALRDKQPEETPE